MSRSDKISVAVGTVSALLTLAFCLSVIVDMIGTSERTAQVVMIVTAGTIGTTVFTGIAFIVGGGVTNDILENL
jgi:hypothetical protein